MIKTGRMRIPLSRSGIMRLKARALRRGVWYRVLSRVERACVDLVIRVVERVRSRLLWRVLASVLGKLVEALESRVWRLVREIGGRLASRVSQIALGWGHGSAGEWASDAGFVRYLTVIYMNAPS